MQYEKHNYNIFPEMQPEDFQRLLSDIKQNGYDSKQPIYLYEGKIVDGWNRYKACNELGVDPVYKQFMGSNSDAVLFIMRTNKRRNLTSSQWAAIAAEADEIWEVIAKQVEEERRRKQAETQAATMKKEPITELIPQQAKPRTETRKIVAETFNTNERYVSDAKKYRTEKPEVFERIKSGETTIAEVKKQEKIEDIKLKKEEYSKRIEDTKDISYSIDIYNTDKKYRVIYADPAWSYNDKCEGGGVQSGGVEIRHYDTMSTKAICDLPINAIAEKDAVLFLWVTSPLLTDGIKVIDAWGFKYKTSFIWDKVSHNMGHYNSVRHEFLLIATKGSCIPDNKKLYDSVQVIEKTRKHSEKPKEFLEIIDDLYQYGERIELFCRKNDKTNWNVWGNEV